MNVLITSASAKVLLVRAFQAALRPFSGKVIAADIAADCPALFAADEAVLVPRVDHPRFADILLRLCRERKITLIVPTRDGELPALAELAPLLANAGTHVLVASRSTLDACADKRAFNSFCVDHGIPIARQHPSDRVPPFPVFVRPVRGAGGGGARRIDDVSAWNALGNERDQLVIQDLVDAPEYSIDALLDLGGQPIQAVVRRRLAVCNGEAYKSRVELLDDLAAATLRLCSLLGCVGHNVVQAFYTPESGPLFIEINPRFGGASNLSIVAGLDSPARILQLLAGRGDEARLLRPISAGLTMLRHSDHIFVERQQLESVDRLP